MTSQIELLFPNLVRDGFRVTSPSTDSYNCIAWAARIVHEWWWPTDGPRNQWPAGVLREESVSAFVAAFTSMGYSPCADSESEFGVEKVAIYAISDLPTHAARQLPNGLWTSKLGELEDIEHTLQGLEGDVYGMASVFMKRPAPSAA